ncbi:MAG: hypothetical protein EA353_05980 [Puniceicoccaceae bacterium]|nr:MAG: hypothetical protein EA353_05980 [Puniceicoccaceae bacterium]
MPLICRHCSTAYSADSGVEGFCCAGCREVHALICREGLDDYYRQQDRVAEPLKDRRLSAPDALAYQQAQDQLERQADAPQGSFTVSGISCMGCVWLIRQLAQRQAGITGVEVSLSGQWLQLAWIRGSFDLAGFSQELLRFGYRLDAKPRQVVDQPRLSPLALRVLLSIIFTGNALLLAGLAKFAQVAALADLLSLACLGFTLLLGGAPFFHSVYRASQIRRWHSDWVPCLMIVVALIVFFTWGLASGIGLSWAAFASSLTVSFLVVGRWLVGLRRGVRPLRGVKSGE